MLDSGLVYIPFGNDQTVYVLGEVRNPKSIQIKMGRLNLLQAISEAGGIVPTAAKEGCIKLIRGDWQQPTVYTLSYSTILETGDRILMRPGDRIVVAPTVLTTINRYMQLLMPFLNAANIGTQMYNNLNPGQ